MAFIKKVIGLELELGLCKRYVDDIFKALRENNPGWYFSRKLTGWHMTPYTLTATSLGTSSILRAGGH